MNDCKALLRWGEDGTLVRHLVDCYARAGCMPVYVVIGGRWEASVRAELLGLPQVRMVVNPDPARGMLSSLVAGVSAAVAAGAMSVVFGPVDLPLRGPDSVARVLGAEPDTEVAVATAGGRPGHPVRVRGRALVALAGVDATERRGSPQTARGVLAGFRRVEIPTGDPGVIGNMNTPAEADQWRRSSEDNDE